MTIVKRGWFVGLLVGAMLAFSQQAAWAGPVIVDGGDLTDHGSRDLITGDNLQGWLYIEKAIMDLLPGVTRSGPFTTDLAALGSADPGAGNFPASDAGGAINSVADNLSLGLTFSNGSSNLTTFFSDLGSGAVNPRIIWLAGNGAANDLTSSEGAVLTANASALNSFVTSGGGLMAIGFNDNALGWLSALLPGISVDHGCDSDGATLTAAGMTAFPGLSNSDIDANAGPCHRHFSGDFGGLSVLALDGLDRPWILGGGSQTEIQGGVVPEPTSLLLFGLGGIGTGLINRRKQRKA